MAVSLNPQAHAFLQLGQPDNDAGDIKGPGGRLYDPYYQFGDGLSKDERGLRAGRFIARMNQNQTQGDKTVHVYDYDQSKVDAMSNRVMERYADLRLRLGYSAEDAFRKVVDEVKDLHEHGNSFFGGGLDTECNVARRVMVARFPYDAGFVHERDEKWSKEGWAKAMDWKTDTKDPDYHELGPV